MVNKTLGKVEHLDGTITVEQNNNINFLVDETLVQLMENIASLYGIDRKIEDTADWQTIYDLKADLFERMKELGINVK